MDNNNSYICIIDGSAQVIKISTKDIIQISYHTTNNTFMIKLRLVSDMTKIINIEFWFNEIPSDIIDSLKQYIQFAIIDNSNLKIYCNYSKNPMPNMITISDVVISVTISNDNLSKKLLS